MVWVTVVPAVAVIGLVVLALVAWRLWRQVKASSRELSAALGRVSDASAELSRAQLQRDADPHRWDPSRQR